MFSRFLAQPMLYVSRGDLSNPVYTIQPNGFDNRVERTVAVGATGLYNRFDNWSDNRLYCVNGASA